MVHRLTRGRLWIGLLATLLVGIVGLNVMALSFSASSSRTGGALDDLERHNSALRAQLASQLSNDELQRTAAKLGLIVPEPGAYGYLEPGADDAAVAAKRLRSGELTFGEAAPAAAVAETSEAAPVVPEEAAPVTAAESTETTAVASTTEPAVAATPAAVTPEATPTAGVAEGGVPAP